MHWTPWLIITATLLTSVQALPRPGLVPAGTLAGRVLSSSGEPAAGVRVAAMEVTEPGTDTSTPAMMAGLARTDEMGRYRLENVPPGRYRVVAGDLENLQYHPDIVTVAAGITIDNLDLTLSNAFGTIETLVHLTGSTQAVPNAVVNVRSLSTGHLRSAVTDENGVVNMKGLEYDSYAVSTPTVSIASIVRNVERDASRAPGQVAVTINVSETQPNWRVKLGVLRPAAWFGVVRDLNGAPVEGARITSLAVGNRLGRRTLQVETSTLTDSDGRYHLLSGLGERYIRVEPPASSMTQADAVSFAPLGGDPGKATPLLVKNGEIVDGVDVVIGRTFRVSGRVGNVAADATIPSIIFVSNSGVDYALTLPNMAKTSGGEFAVRGVPEGSWNVFAAVAGSPGSVARASVEIAGKDVEGLEATLTTTNIVGRLVVEGGGDAGTPSVNLVSREHVPSNVGQVSHTRSPATDGTFRFQNVLPLRYGIQVSGLRLGWYVTDIRVAGVSVFNDAVVSSQAQPSSEVGEVEIPIAQGTGKLEGSVSLPPNTRLNDARVVLAPDAPRRGNPLLYRTAVIRPDGRFIMLPEPAPGNYSVFAIPYLPAGGAELDPAFLERYEPFAVPVTIAPNQTTTLDLELREPR